MARLPDNVYDWISQSSVSTRRQPDVIAALERIADRRDVKDFLADLLRRANLRATTNPGGYIASAILDEADALAEQEEA